MNYEGNNYGNQLLCCSARNEGELEASDRLLLEDVRRGTLMRRHAKWVNGDCISRSDTRCGECRGNVVRCRSS